MEYLSNDIVIKDSQGRIIIKGRKNGGLYALGEACKASIGSI